MSKTDLGAFIHNLYIMCHYCRTDLKKTDFFNGCQKFISSSFCTANVLFKNSTRLATNSRIEAINMKKSNFFSEYLKEIQQKQIPSL
jgi:hypothetical protein